MKKLDAPAAVVHTDRNRLHLDIVVPEAPDEQGEWQCELQAFLRIYERMKTERIKEGH